AGCRPGSRCRPRGLWGDWWLPWSDADSFGNGSVLGVVTLVEVPTLRWYVRILAVVHTAAGDVLLLDVCGGYFTQHMLLIDVDAAEHPAAVDVRLVVVVVGQGQKGLDLRAAGAADAPGLFQHSHHLLSRGCQPNGYITVAPRGDEGLEADLGRLLVATGLGDCQANQWRLEMVPQAAVTAAHQPQVRSSVDGRAVVGGGQALLPEVA